VLPATDMVVAAVDGTLSAAVHENQVLLMSGSMHGGGRRLVSHPAADGWAQLCWAVGRDLHSFHFTFSEDARLTSEERHQSRLNMSEILTTPTCVQHQQLHALRYLAENNT
jgi:hypothetical protein